MIVLRELTVQNVRDQRMGLVRLWNNMFDWGTDIGFFSEEEHIERTKALAAIDRLIELQEKRLKAMLES